MSLQTRASQQLFLSPTGCSFITPKGDSVGGVFLILDIPSLEQETKQQQAIPSSLPPLPQEESQGFYAVVPQKQHLWSPSSTVSFSS